MTAVTKINSLYKYFLVEYDPSDPISKLFSYITLAPIMLVIAGFAITYYKRDLRLVLYNLGLLFSTMVNKFLKHQIFRQPRPEYKFQFPLKDFGMPSDHTQVMCFITVMYILFSLEKSKKVETTVKHSRTNNLNVNYVNDIINYLECLGLIFLTFLVGVSRIYLYYHTIAQVTVGAVVGIFWAIIYYSFIVRRLDQVLDNIRNSFIGKQLKLE